MIFAQTKVSSTPLPISVPPLSPHMKIAMYEKFDTSHVRKRKNMKQ